jgi:hypothetical protein
MKTAGMSKLRVKAVIVFFNIRDIIMVEWVQEYHAVNEMYCLGVLTKLQERGRMKRPEW